MRLAVAFLGAVILTAVGAAHALTLRGDSLWRGEWHCPEHFVDPDFDDSAWPPVSYPWMQWLPRPWPADPDALPFWEATGHGKACVRRTFELQGTPSGPAIAKVWVDQDYELYLNGTRVGGSADRQATMPGERYDVSASLHPGRNVIALQLDGGGLMAAQFSLTIPGIPDPPVTAAEREHAAMPWLIVLGAGIGFVLVFALVAWVRRVAAPLAARLSPNAARLLAIATAIVCEYVLLTRNLYDAPWDHPRAVWNWPAVALAAGIFVFLFLIRPTPLEGPEAPVAARRAWLIMGGVLLLALFLRTYRLDGIPVGFWGDESLNGNEAIDYLRLETWQVWSPSVGGRGTLFLYVVGIVLKLFGVSYLTLKIVPVAFGIATVAALYAFARVGFGPRTALWAAFFLAVARTHIHFSRIAWEAICVPLISCAGFALLLYGLGRGRRATLSLLASGVVLSAGLYTYAAYRAIPAVTVVFVIATTLSADRRVIFDRLRPLLGAALLAILVALPLVFLALRDPHMYWARYDDVALTSYMTYYRTPVPWLTQFAKGFLALTHRGDELVRHNLPWAPHLDPITATLFLLGLATAAGLRSHGARLLWCWLFTFLALATLTIDGPHATRLLGLAPAAAVFAALAITRVGAPLVNSLGWRPLAVGLAGVLAVATTGANAYQYFVLEANHPAADYMYDFTARSLCEYVRHFDKIELYWTGDIAFLCDSQCNFLARGQNTRHDVVLSQLLDGSFPRSAPAGHTIVVLGAEFLQLHKHDIPLDENGIPQVKLPGYPRLDYDRAGHLLYALYQF